MVLEMQGGIEPRSAAVLHRIAEAVAAGEEKDVGVCKRELLQRLALIIARRTSSMIRRRFASVSLAPRIGG